MERVFVCVCVCEGVCGCVCEGVCVCACVCVKGKVVRIKVKVGVDTFCSCFTGNMFCKERTYIGLFLVRSHFLFCGNKMFESIKVGVAVWGWGEVFGWGEGRVLRKGQLMGREMVNVREGAEVEMGVVSVSSSKYRPTYMMYELSVGS